MLFNGSSAVDFLQITFIDVAGAENVLAEYSDKYRQCISPFAIITVHQVADRGAHTMPNLESRKHREVSSIHCTIYGFVRNTIRHFAVMGCTNKQVLSAGNGSTVSGHATSP